MFSENCRNRTYRIEARPRMFGPVRQRTAHNSGEHGAPRACTFRGSDRSVFRPTSPSALSNARVRGTPIRPSRFISGLARKILVGQLSRVLIEGNEQRYRIDFKESHRRRSSDRGRCWQLLFCPSCETRHQLQPESHHRQGQHLQFHAPGHLLLIDDARFEGDRRARGPLRHPIRKDSPPSRPFCSTRRGSSSKTRPSAIMSCRRRRPGASTTRP